MKIQELLNTDLITESVIDNVKGWGAVPDNQNVEYLGLRVLMKPSQFLKLASPLKRSQATSVDQIRSHMESGGKIGAPWLEVGIPPEWSQGDYTKTARITGHEGRNRMMALQEIQGDEPVETHIFLGGGLRARDLTPEWISHMIQGMQAQRSDQIVPGPTFVQYITEQTTRTSKSGAPGTLKAKITKTYGGGVTCAKAERFKRRHDATPHDKSQANWFLNMNCGGASKLTEIFQEPALSGDWHTEGSGDNIQYVSEFPFENHTVRIYVVPDVRQVAVKHVMRSQDMVPHPQTQGFVVGFQVDGAEHVTHALGAQSVKVFTQVVSRLKWFLSHVTWHYVVFFGEPGSRNQLYTRLAQRLANQLQGDWHQHQNDFVVFKHVIDESAGVGLIVPGVNMPPGQHPDEIRRQARKFGFKVSAQGVPPVARTDGKY